MAVTVINVGTSANDNTGDTLRGAFIKTNSNFDILSTTSKLGNGDLTINDVRVGKGLGNIGSNTVVGAGALANNISGQNNTAIGLGALTNNQSGGANTANGVNALYLNTIGNNNTANGVNALSNNQSGDANNAYGVNALSNNTTFSNSTGLGSNAQVTASNQVQLGDSATTTYVYGTVQNRSDIRDKAEIRDTVLGLDFINELRPVDYKWDMREDYRTEMPSQLDLDATEEEKEAYKILMDEWLESVKLDSLNHDGTHTRTRYHHGLIAQEVQDVIEASGVDFGGFQDHKVNGGGDVLSLGYSELIAPMIKAIQELTARINVLENN